MASWAGRGFGWTLALRGRGVAEVERTIAGLRRQVEALASAYFPAAEGFAVESVDEGGRLRLAVRRGDFAGQVEFVGTCPEGQSGDGLLRLSGRGGSASLAAAERSCLRVAEGLRWLMGSFGAIFMGLVLASLFVVPPRFAVETLFFLGGLLLVVIGGLTMTVSVGIGAWLGEYAAGWIGHRALARVQGDAALHEDLERWRALCRALSAQREAAAGSLRRQPFRHERALWDATGAC